MASIDIFKSDAFSTFQMTEAVEKVPFQPMALGELNIFDPDPIRTTAVAVEQRQGKLLLIPLSERGQAGTQRTTEQRQLRYFDVPRLMHSDRITAAELQNIRTFGTESDLMQVQAEVARRFSGPTGLMASVEYTKEYLRLAAVQGYVLNPLDGSVKFNWFDEFGITPAAEIAFNLSAGTANSLRPLINGMVRDMARAAQGAFTPATRVVALCGDAFYDEFVNHPDVIRTFVNWSDARDIRGGTAGGAFQAFEFAGVTWLNYRGSDDNASIKIATDKVKFFPVNAPGVFREAMAPGETFEWANTPGKPVYALQVPDRDRNMWVDIEVYAYPLMICTRPEVLRTGRKGS